VITCEIDSSVTPWLGLWGQLCQGSNIESFRWQSH
jgi:hypothetical protein